ncbi:hypothetical protein ACJJTC_007254 [Scirpophaga incertulas]
MAAATCSLFYAFSIKYNFYSTPCGPNANIKVREKRQGSIECDNHTYYSYRELVLLETSNSIPGGARAECIANISRMEAHCPVSAFAYRRRGSLGRREGFSVFID